MGGVWSVVWMEVAVVVAWDDEGDGGGWWRVVLGACCV